MEKAELMKLGPIRQILQNCTIEVGIVSNLKNSNTSEVTNRIENCWGVSTFGRHLTGWL